MGSSTEYIFVVYMASVTSSSVRPLLFRFSGFLFLMAQNLYCEFLARFWKTRPRFPLLRAEFSPFFGCAKWCFIYISILTRFLSIS